MLFSHILYGSVAVMAGNVRYSAKAAGRRGEALSVAVVADPAASAIAIAVDRRMGAQSVTITLPPGATEAQLVAALAGNGAARELVTASVVAGNGSAAAATLAPTTGAASGGLRQALEARFQSLTGELMTWENRDLIATAEPVGLLWPASARSETMSVWADVPDRWSGLVEIGVAMTHETGLEVENALLDLFRSRLHRPLKFFSHPQLGDKGPIEYVYANVTKDEAAGKALGGARLHVVARMPMRWAEPPDDGDFLDEFPATEFRFGLFREPVATSVQVVGDGEIKDSDIILTAE